jgi:hypothetical protein
MQRARRLASVAVIASLALAGLAACRSSPDTVAYIGGGDQAVRISNDHVEEIYTDAQAKQTGARKNTDGTETQPTQVTRSEIVSTMIGLEVLREYGRQKNITPEPLPAADVADSVFLAPDAKYVPIYTEYLGYMQAILGKVQPSQITEADVRQVYDRLVAAGAVTNTDFQTWAGGLSQQDQQTIGQRVVLQKELQPVAAKMNIDVNPRYPSEFAVLQTHGRDGRAIPLIVVPVGDTADADPVEDLG